MYTNQGSWEMKFIAKEDGWFKTGSECELLDFLYDSPEIKDKDGNVTQQSNKAGVFLGIRVADSENEPHPIGTEYEKSEVCLYSEFDIKYAEREK